MILVTGAAGFIGSHVAEALVRSGRPVVGLDNLSDSYSPAIKRKNLSGLGQSREFRLIEGDVRDPALVESILSGEKIEAIVHLAALAGVRPSVVDPVPYMDVNVGGTALLLARASAHKVGRFILASSSSVYGNSARAPFTEDDPAVEPISPYGASKRAAELVAHSFHHLTGLPTTILRLFTVYGPRQRPEMAIHRFTRKVLAGESIPLFGDGATKRDYTFVSDIVDGILACLALGSGLATVNLGGAHPVSLKELVELIAKVCDRPARVEHHPPQPGDVELTCADISRAGRVLGFCPRVGLLQGLERFVHWFKEQTVAV